MGEGLVDVAQRLADSGKQVIISGLDTDYLGRPFRADSGSAGACRVDHQDARDLRAVRQSGEAYAAAARVGRPDRGRGGGYVRSAVPAVLRAGHSEADRAGFREGEAAETSGTMPGVRPANSRKSRMRWAWS